MQRRDFLKMAGIIGISRPHPGACEITRVDFGGLGPSAVPNLLVPEGFTVRRLATSGAPVLRSDGSSTGYTWHPSPDGGGVFPIVEDGAFTGWVYTSNRESIPGGAGAIRFDTAGNVVDAYPILSGTLVNCAGGVMPFPAGWTWVSCEEFEGGQAWECNPFASGQGIARPAMGRFYREAVAADPWRSGSTRPRTAPNGGFYRFTPTTWGDLSAGLLEIMIDLGGGAVGWAEVPNPSGTPTTTRTQTPVGGGTVKRFNGGEGVWYTDGNVYFTTKGDNRVWRYTPATNVLTVVYDDTDPFPSPRHLTGVDNVVATTTNRVFVAEDGGNMEIVGLDVETGATYPILRYEITGSEITGPAFSADGTRLYFSSQRNPGETFEVTGPWNTNAPTAPEPSRAVPRAGRPPAAPRRGRSSFSAVISPRPDRMAPAPERNRRPVRAAGGREPAPRSRGWDPRGRGAGCPRATGWPACPARRPGPSPAAPSRRR